MFDVVKKEQKMNFEQPIDICKLQIDSACEFESSCSNRFSQLLKDSYSPVMKRNCV